MMMAVRKIVKNVITHAINVAEEIPLRIALLVIAIT
jgi:hypothetical protein